MSSGGKGIESRGFHLHGEKSKTARMRDSRLGFAVRRVGGPSSAAMNSNARKGAQSLLHTTEKRFVRGLCECRCRQIVIAGSFVPKSAVDQHEIGRVCFRQVLPRRCHANQK